MNIITAVGNSAGHLVTRCNTQHILLFGFLLRFVFSIAYVLFSGSHSYFPLSAGQLPHTGVDGYIQIAHTLLHSGKYALSPDGYPVSFRGPAQPLLMLVTCAWSDQYWAIIWVIFASAMGTTTIFVTGRTVSLLSGTKDSLAGKAAMLLVALQPYLIFSTKTPTAIVTLTLVFSVTCLLWLNAFKFPSLMFTNVALGVTLGFGVLLHGSFLPVTALAVFLLFFLGLRNKLTVRAKQAAAILLTVFIILLPWLLRNKAAYGEALPILTGSGLQYWIADGCYFHGPGTTEFGYAYSQEIFKNTTGRELILANGGVSREDDLLLLKMAKKHIIECWYLIPARFIQGAWRFWAPTDAGLRKALIVAATNVPYVAFFFVSLFFSVRSRQFRAEYLGPLLLMLCFYGLFSCLQAISVYFVVILPAMLALACACAFPQPQNHSGSCNTTLRERVIP